jgi:UV DNA damage repair endonuclease
MDKYKIFKNEVLKLSQKYKIKENESIKKSSNSGLFAAGLHKGKAQESKEISNDLRNLIAEIESIKENKTA